MSIETRSLKEIAATLIDSLGAEALTETTTNESRHAAHAKVVSAMNEIWAVSSNPLAFLGKVMETYNGMDKEVVRTRKRSIIKAVKTARDLDIVGVFDRTAKVYRFELKPEKPEKGFEEFCAEVMKRMDKSGFDKTAILLQLQEMITTGNVPVVAHDPLDDLI